MEEENYKDLEEQELWVRCRFNGYSFDFHDKSLHVGIEIRNPDYPDKSAFKGSHLVFCPINADENGEVDLTDFLHTFLHYMKENPDRKVIAKVTAFSRQLHFNKDLLSVPIAQSILDLFSKDEK